jgi:hypothetical protein
LLLSNYTPLNGQKAESLEPKQMQLGKRRAAAEQTHEEADREQGIEAHGQAR